MNSTAISRPAGIERPRQAISAAPASVMRTSIMTFSPATCAFARAA
jgi:hypothetical protein